MVHLESNNNKTINLALQGGGAHGAFAWGVLDKLLEDGRLDIEGFCATSAGTMNACAYAYGKMRGGKDMARETLHNFWWNTHLAGKRNSLPQMPWSNMGSENKNGGAAFFLLDSITRMFSPYQLNPFDYNPLREVLEKTVDFEELRKCQCTDIFISATHVRTGKVRVFHNEEVTLDVAMASACLPFLFKAVNIDGEDYWDGGYMGNPSLFPLFYKTKSRDIMIIHINPMERAGTPKTAMEITNRINEISFNSSLIMELRSIAFIKKLIQHDMLKQEHKNDFKNVIVHSIRADDAVADLSVASKFNTDWEFLISLRDKGRETMAAWLDKNFDDVGKHDTVDLHSEFLTSVTDLFEDEHGDHRHGHHGHHIHEPQKKALSIKKQK